MVKGKIVFVDETQGTICLANADGTQSRTLATNGKNPLPFPSRDKIAYMTQWADPNEIVIIDLAGKVLKHFQCEGVLAGLTRLTDVSSDGAEIMFGAYNATSKKSAIYSLSIGDGTVSKVLESDDVTSLAPGCKEIHVGDGSWSSSGDRIAFTVSCLKAGAAIGIMRRDGSELRLATEFPANPKEWSGFRNCGWSSDGRGILALDFHFAPDDQRYVLPYGMHIFVVDVDGKSIRKVPNDYRYSREDPCWSPDGSKIIYSEVRAMSESKAITCLMIMNADGTDPHRVFRGSRFSFIPFMGAENTTSPRWWTPKE